MILLLLACRSPDDTDAEPLAEAWASYGHDLANTRAAPAGPEAPEEAWRLDGIAVTSTPAVVDGVVWFGDWSGTLRAVSAADGSAISSTILADAALDDSPAAGGALVYVGDGQGVLHAVDRATGAVEWSAPLDPHESAHLFSSPVIVGGLVVVGVASTELARVKEDYTFRGSLVAVDALTGEERWRVYTSEDDASSGAGVSVWSSIAADEARGLVFVGTGNAYEPPAGPLSDALLAVRVDRGELLWSRQFTEGDVYTVFAPLPKGPDADIGAAPNLFRAGDRDVVGVGDKAGVYAALDRETGETVWAAKLTEGSHLGGVMTSAAVGDAVYVASNAWDDLAEASPGDVSDLVALALADGAELWRAPLPSPAFGAVTLAGDTVWVGTLAGSVYGFAASDGAPRGSVTPGEPIGGGLSAVDGALFVGHGFSFFTEASLAPGGIVAYR